LIPVVEDHAYTKYAAKTDRRKKICFKINKYTSSYYLQSNSASPRHVWLYNFGRDFSCMLNDQEHVLD